MQNARLWFARIVTIYALAIFAFLDEGLSWLLFVAALVSHPRV